MSVFSACKGKVNERGSSDRVVFSFKYKVSALLRSTKTKTSLLKMLFDFFNKRPMGHIAHLRKQFKSINTYDNIIKKKKNIIIFMRIKWFLFEQN